MAPSWEALRVKVCCDGRRRVAASCRGRESAGDARPGRSKSKSWGSTAGSVTLTTFSDACLVFVNVQIDGLARVDVERGLGASPVASSRRRRRRCNEVGQRPAGDRRLGHRLGAELGAASGEGLLRGQGRVAGVVVEVEVGRRGPCRSVEVEVLGVDGRIGLLDD